MYGAAAELDWMNRFFRAGLVVALVPLAAAAAISCERGRPPSEQPAEAAAGSIREVASAAAPPAVSGEARAEAESIFGERCAVCHGDNGEGNGPGASNLNPKPVNFHNQKWQRSISDERIAKAIIYGGQAVGVSASMAPNPDLESKPEIVAALVERIRKLGK
jgi:mono/diheme cytochrome c family protein